ncbi:MinD-like ATPase involved in chromosome partitioning or flagellar assembly [Microbacterium sp. SORGH_AS 505]|uniref:AAA family ATPase n=1 Tax=Microbacterium sp. SORGH_AS_0505 TaxID=3041770 RepID=UPI0027875E2E|nr:AAA family ATPase [Microbacterium sp. SORGH_AS_0505]MDQ1124996.1 MinD-like ATPase involved in chromosome partitioning or flagellar assembly [Microbacterium sp. SORGH_AS_0505]
MSIGSDPARATAHVTGGTARFTATDGAEEMFEAADADAVRRLVVDRVRADAAATGTPIELLTSGDRGDHRLVVDPAGDIDVELDDRTVTRAELRQQAWWTTDPEPADQAEPEAELEAEPGSEADPEPEADPKPEADPEPEADSEPHVEPVLVAEVPAFFPPSAGDDGDDDDLDDPTPAGWEPARVTEIPAAAPVTAPAPDDAASGGPTTGTDPVEVARASFAAEDQPAPVEVAATEPAAPEAFTPEVTTPDATPAADTAFEASAAQGPRPSFIEPPSDHPATVTGWRAFFVRIGLPVKPSKAEIERAEREKAVSRQWAGCRAIAVANGKGGVGKTMTTAVLSAVFARHGGGNVLAWDNNDTRGTLGWRTEQGDYDTTIRDLLPEAPRLLEATASVSDIARFVHHQSVDRYDVLRSNPELLAADQRITTADFDLLAQVAARYYRMVIFDSGNDESADRWLRMIDSAHQLVVPTLAAPESAESAALLLDALRKRDEHSRRLADGAVVVVGQSERAGIGAAQRIAAGFEGHVRAVEIIPFDDSLKAGRIRYDALQPRTKDAWMRAAAAVARGL